MISINNFSSRQIISLLIDIVYFLACQENNGSDPFDVQILKPNRERQKLIREQNILKQVCSFSLIQTSISLCFLFSVIPCSSRIKTTFRTRTNQYKYIEKCRILLQ
jgi:magnesium-transporting ATPase (P-type)